MAQDTFRAFAHEDRRRILSKLLSLGPLTVTELMDLTNVNSQPMLSKHLKVMRDSGLVTARKDGRNTLYTAQASALETMVRAMQEMINSGQED